MALDYRVTQNIKPPELDDPALAYSRALTNRRGEQILEEQSFGLEEARAQAKDAREARMRQAKIKQILASSPTPHDALVRLEREDPDAAHELKGQFADHTLKMLMGVSNYQAVPSAWPEVQKYLGADAPMPTFQNQDEFDQWKRQQILARADFKTYLEQTKPAAAKTEPNPNEYTIALQAAAGDEKAIKALEIIKAQKAATAGADGGFTLAPGGRRYDATGKVIAEAPERPEKAGGGPKPRGVTAGSANRITDINTAIGEAKSVRGELSGVAGATGNTAALGASVPKWVTNATGFGLEAKQKQATIDRVKQIIGKGLEGGVLRKEDEYKYEKILPTIADDPALVTSKLNGLDAALVRKRDEELSSLEDAGYDVSRYRAREAAAPKDNATAFSVKAPNGTTYTFKSKADLDAFKTRAGIK